MSRKRAAKGEPQKWLRGHVNYKGTGCLIWPFGRSGTGYAQVYWGGRPHTASRIMCILAHGPAPEGKQEVAHSCGNRRCVNPRHLRHASWVENSADKIAHGRENYGHRNGMAKLSEADAMEIIRLYQTGDFTQVEIGKRFGVAGTAVCRILSGDRWPHLKREADKTAIKKALLAGETIPGAALELGDGTLTIRTR